MKKTLGKILAIVLAMTFIFSLVPTTAGAEKVSQIEGLNIRAQYRVEVGQPLTVSKSSYASELMVYPCGFTNNHGVLDYDYNASGTAVTFTAQDEGVYLVFFENLRKLNSSDPDSAYESLDSSWIIIVAEKGDIRQKDMGCITKLYDTEASCNYKSNKDDNYLWSEYDADYGKYGPYYTEYYVYEGGDGYVDEYGSIDTDIAGDSYGTYYVIDAQCNVYRASFSATVKYAWWQWIIRILLLGFLWY